MYSNDTFRFPVHFCWHTLHECCVDVQGLGRQKAEQYLQQQSAMMVEFIGVVVKDKTRDDGLTKVAVGLLGDMAISIPSIGPLFVNKTWIREVIQVLDQVHSFLTHVLTVHHSGMSAVINLPHCGLWFPGCSLLAQKMPRLLHALGYDSECKYCSVATGMSSKWQPLPEGYSGMGSRGTGGSCKYNSHLSRMKQAPCRMYCQD